MELRKRQSASKAKGKQQILRKPQHSNFKWEIMKKRQSSKQDLKALNLLTGKFTANKVHRSRPSNKSSPVEKKSNMKKKIFKAAGVADNYSLSRKLDRCTRELPKVTTESRNSGIAKPKSSWQPISAQEAAPVLQPASPQQPTSVLPPRNSVISPKKHEDSTLQDSEVIHFRPLDVSVLPCSKLFTAAANGEAQMLGSLLKKGADVNIMDSVGRTILMLACEHGHLKCVNLLLKGGACVNMEGCRSYYDWNPLGLAVNNGHDAIIKLLLNKGADVNGFCPLSKGVYGTMLMLAVKQDHATVVKTLINAGADVNVVDYYGRSSLMYVCEKGNIRCAKILLKAGADVNAEGCQA